MKFLFIVNKQVSLEVADSGENATKKSHSLTLKNFVDSLDSTFKVDSLLKLFICHFQYRLLF